MNLQEMLDQAATGTAHVEEGWGQGRATYGGLVGGLMHSALAGFTVSGLWFLIFSGYHLRNARAYSAVAVA